MKDSRDYIVCRINIELSGNFTGFKVLKDTHFDTHITDDKDKSLQGMEVDSGITIDCNFTSVKITRGLIICYTN